MKESYGEGLASHTGPESCGGIREEVTEAWTGVRAGRVLSRETAKPALGRVLRGADAVVRRRRPHRPPRYREGWTDLARSQTPSTHGNLARGNREIPFVVGFEHRVEAARFLADLRARVARFGLALHPDKTRLIEFGRDADRRRRARGDGRPDTFAFLGFTHLCAKTQQGRFTVRRQTMRQRWQAKLRAVKTVLWTRLHDPVPETGAYLRAVVQGHVRYYGVPLNTAATRAFRWAIGRLWYRVLRRRSQRTRLTWDRMARLIAQWLPPAVVCHPYPRVRLAFSPKARAGCGNAARPDLWRG